VGFGAYVGFGTAFGCGVLRTLGGGGGDVTRRGFVAGVFTAGVRGATVAEGGAAALGVARVVGAAGVEDVAGLLDVFLAF
jgi:hypothetical protein